MSLKSLLFLFCLLFFTTTNTVTQYNILLPRKEAVVLEDEKNNLSHRHAKDELNLGLWRKKNNQRTLCVYVCVCVCLFVCVCVYERMSGGLLWWETSIHFFRGW